MRTEEHVAAASVAPGSQGLCGADPLIAQLFASYASSLRRLARHLVRDAALAEDIVQDVFLRLHVAPGNFDPDRGTAQAYLLACTRWRSFDVIRSEVARAHRQGAVAIGADEAVDHVERDAVHAELRAVLARALVTLPDRERVPVMMAFFGGLTHDRIAELLDEPVGTVKSRIRRGLIRLRPLLDRSALS